MAVLLGAGIANVALGGVLAFASGWSHPGSYVLYCTASTLVLAALLGAAVGRLGQGTAPALVVWAFLSGAVTAGWPAGLLMGGALWFVACRSRRAGACTDACSSALRLGALVGVVLSLSLLFAAKVWRGAGSPLLSTQWGEALSAGVLVFCLLWILLPLVSRPLGWSVVALGLVLASQPAWKTTGARPIPDGALASRVAEAAAPHVVILVLDTVRADHLSIYGYGRQTTPELQRWVQQRKGAVVHTRAFSNGAWTVPSHASLFTGTLPSTHGAHFGSGTRFAFKMEAERTLAEVAAERGYVTLGVFANNWLRVVDGMRRGFDRFVKGPEVAPLPSVGEGLRAWLTPGLWPEVTKAGVRGDGVNAALLDLVDQVQGSRLYLFANYGEAHGPYAPNAEDLGTFAPAGWRDRPEHLSILHSEDELQRFIARYDEEILGLDRHLGDLLGSLDERGILDEAWVFITADHGEAFGDHGVTEHGTSVFNDQVLVPLIILPPDGQSLDVGAGPVSLVDVARTAAAIMGGDLGGAGRDLRQAATGGERVAIEFYGDPKKASRHGSTAALPARAVITGSTKLVARGEERLLFDLASSPDEDRDLSSERLEDVRRLELLLPQLVYRDGAAPGSISEEDLEALRAAGYMGDG